MNILTLHLWYDILYANILEIIKGIYMKICNSCKNNFQPSAREKHCSTKCKILENVKKSGDCWIWTGATAGQYGKIRFRGKTYSAHRTSHLVFKGDIPKGKWVCHKCDVPKCVNPAHLFLGSPSDNRVDAMRKKRVLINGLHNKWARFTDIQIEEMKMLHKDGFSYSRLMRIFNCSMPYLNKLFNNRVRKDIP